MHVTMRAIFNFSHCLSVTGITNTVYAQQRSCSASEIILKHHSIKYIIVLNGERTLGMYHMELKFNSEDAFLTGIESAKRRLAPRGSQPLDN